MFPISINDEETNIPSLSEDTEFCRYILGKDGLYIRKGLQGIFRAQVPVSGCGFLKTVETAVDIQLPKIKAERLMATLAFFYKIYQDHKTEATAFIFYNPEKKDFIFPVPFQKVSGASAVAVGAVANIEGYQRIGTIHSHCNMSLGHSGTDVNDEKFFDGIHIVAERIPMLEHGKVELVATAAINGVRIKLDPEDLFEGFEKFVEPEKPPVNANATTGYKGNGVYVYGSGSGYQPPYYNYNKSEKVFKIPFPLEQAKFDQSWLERVQVTTPVYNGWQGGTVHGRKNNYVVPTRTSAHGKVVSLKDYQQKSPGTVTTDPCTSCPFSSSKKGNACGSCVTTEAKTVEKITDPMKMTAIYNEREIEKYFPKEMPESGIQVINPGYAISKDDDKPITHPTYLDNKKNDGRTILEEDYIYLPEVDEYAALILQAVKQGLFNEKNVDAEIRAYIEFRDDYEFIDEKEIEKDERSVIDAEFEEFEEHWGMTRWD